MAKKAVKKITAKKSDKSKAPAKSKDKVVAKIEANSEVPKAVRPVVQQASVAPVAQQAPEVTPDVDQWKKDHVTKHKISHPYFHVKGGIYRTSDGKLFANPEEFHADGGTMDQVHGV